MNRPLIASTSLKANPIHEISCMSIWLLEMEYWDDWQRRILNKASIKIATIMNGGAKTKKYSNISEIDDYSLLMKRLKNNIPVEQKVQMT